MDKEIWKPIKGFEGYYEISDKGRVKSLGRLVLRRTSNIHTKEKILKLPPCKNGYIVTHLHKDGKAYHSYVHRLVADAFLPNPYNKTEIDHIDTDRSNNKVENLRWCTRSENNYNPITNKRMSLSHIGHKLKKESIEKWRKTREANGWKINYPLNSGKSKAVVQINPSDNSIVRTFPSMQEVKRVLAFTPSNISQCCRGKREMAHGYIWKYAESNG